MMGSKIWIWRNIPGISGRCNDVVYMPSKLQPISRDLLVFFGGDVQDIQEEMEKHSDSKKFTKWCLENTATMLSEQFPESHVFVVRPSRMTITKQSVFSCFDNFVSGDKYGTPTFCPMHKALKHLRDLLIHCLDRVKTLKMQESIDSYNIEDTNLSLIGFSKGCAVLNQFLYEFHYYNSNKDSDMNNFIKLIKDIWWLDGGHNGSENTWITNQEILHSFAELRINAHIHVTPYQIQDNNRPWIRREEYGFTSTLQRIGVSVERILHFDDQTRNILSHFKVLTVLKSNIQ